MHAQRTTPQDPNGSAGNVRTILAVLSMIVMLSLGTAVTAIAGGGGIGTGGGDGGDETGRQGGGDRYRKAWNSFSDRDKRWARTTSECESGGDPKIHSPGRTYHGAFQFLKSTWQSSPMSKGSDPHRYNWKTQAVVAVKLKHQQGSSPWPNCG